MLTVTSLLVAPRARLHTDEHGRHGVAARQLKEHRVFADRTRRRTEYCISIIIFYNGLIWLGLDLPARGLVLLRRSSEPDRGFSRCKLHGSSIGAPTVYAEEAVQTTISPKRLRSGRPSECPVSNVLLSLYVQGKSADAFQLLSDEYYAVVQTIVNKRIRHIGVTRLWEMRGDIAHGALLRIHQSLINKEDLNVIHSLNGWIWTHCVREVIDTMRKQQRVAGRTVPLYDHVSAPDDDSIYTEESLFEAVSQSQRIRDVRRCMAALTDRAQAALNLRLSGVEVPEIAERLELKPVGVHALLRRARLSVVECLKNCGWEPAVA